VYLLAQALANAVLGAPLDGKRGHAAANGSHNGVAYSPLGVGGGFLAGAELELADLEDSSERGGVLFAGDRARSPTRAGGSHVHRK
jgi:hypothetical protein